MYAQNPNGLSCLFADLYPPAVVEVVLKQRRDALPTVVWIGDVPEPGAPCRSEARELMHVLGLALLFVEAD